MKVFSTSSNFRCSIVSAKRQLHGRSFVWKFVHSADIIVLGISGYQNDSTRRRNLSSMYNFWINANVKFQSAKGFHHEAITFVIDNFASGIWIFRNHSFRKVNIENCVIILESFWTKRSLQSTVCLWQFRIDLKIEIKCEKSRFQAQ